MSCRNVEIKAKVKDLPSFLLKCEEVSQSVGEVIKQEDIFFNAKEGRLKLRKFEGGAAELIFYDRPNMEGPKLSEYDKCSVSDGSKLQTVLSRALGVSGEVKKFRHLFLVGQTRIHVDQVENLGSFMELEVVLSKNQTPEDGKRIADNLMNELGVCKEDLISTAYVDLLKAKT